MSRMTRRAASAVLGSLVLLAVTAGPIGAAESRTDHRPDGNRVADGRGPLREAVDVTLASRPAWIVPSPLAPGSAWVVADADGTLTHVDEHGSVERIGELPPLAPPLAALGADGELVVEDARVERPDVLPGARAVTTRDGTMAVLVGPTDRYAHAVLGDELEASALAITSRDGSTRMIRVGDDAVIEGSSPIAADLDGDGVDELIVTISDTATGARLRAYAVDGAIVGESEPIGRGFRWRHQIAVAPLGPDGEVELVSVRTPHIGGIVEAFRLVDDRLELVAAASGFSSHRIGSPNLDMAVVADVSGDGGPLEVIVPTDVMTELGVLARSGDEFVLQALLPLDGRLVTNIAAASDADGRLALAVGTDDGRLRIFR